MRTPGARGWGFSKAAIGFRSEFLDFARGIRVGNLEPHERITRILKAGLEARYGQEFVTERWGRGVYWQWIGFLVRANRAAKPLSSGVSFGCSKLFITVDGEDGFFKCGLQIERGFVRAPADFRECRLRSDWDWHRLVKGVTPRGALMAEVRRLVGEEGFRLQAGSWGAPHVFEGEPPTARALQAALADGAARDWCAFQLYYGQTEQDIRGTSGTDLVEMMMAVFDEVTPAMNLCSQVSIGGSVPVRPQCGTF